MKYNTICITLLVMFLFGCGSANTGKQLKIDDFAGALSEAGLDVGEKNEMWFQMVMATDGWSFIVNGQIIEAYQFDTEIQSGREAIEKWEREGMMGQRVIVQHNLMMLLQTDHKDWETILGVFESL